MKYVIMSSGTIPGYGVRGPVLTPRTYNIHQVLKWLAVGVDVREVMEDGSFRKLHFNDPKLVEEANKDLDKRREAKKAVEEELKSLNVEKTKKVARNVDLLPLEKPKENVKPNKKVKVNKVEEKKEEKVKVKEEKIDVNIGKIDLPIDNLEKPE